MTIVAIGWDVRGWRGNQQAVAVLKLDGNEKQWSLSGEFQFQPGQTLGLESLISQDNGCIDEAILKDADRIVVGIDAPLAFPSSFIELLNNDDSMITPTDTEIQNPLAYRDCERWIYKKYGKKPLSAAFDKLGNGATLAISMTHALMQDGFELIPQTAQYSDRAVIEVYPGIHKTELTRASPAIEPVHRLIPEDIVVGTDQYDAAVCAITAAIFAGAGDILSLPNVINFQSEFDPKEGWVYGLPVEFIHKFQF